MTRGPRSRSGSFASAVGERHSTTNARPEASGRAFARAAQPKPRSFWIVRPDLSLDELEAALRAARIEFTSGPDPWNPGCVKIIAASGVEMIVGVEEEYRPPGLATFYMVRSPGIAAPPMN